MNNSINLFNIYWHCAYRCKSYFGFDDI